MYDKNMLSSSSWNFLQLFQFFAPKIGFAVLCGGLIGLERELKNKHAGIKTNILICLGSALYTSVSLLMSSALYEAAGYQGDPSRIAAQIVPGIGFLGAGAIIQSRGGVMGLTTAATIWIVGAIGICIGIGHTDIAVLSSVTVIVVLVGTTFFEDRILGRSLTFACEIVADDPEGEVRLGINQALAQNDLTLDDFDIAAKNNATCLTFKYSGHRNDHRKFVLDLWRIPGIREVKQV